MPHSYTIYIAFVLLQLGYAAQQAEAQIPGNPVKGTVLDHYGHPLEGVTVSVKGTGHPVLTDRQGVFQIMAPAGGRLVIEHPGFDVSEAPVKQALTIRLTERYLQRPDRVALLYEDRPAGKVWSAASTIYTAQLNTTPASIYPFALPGRLAGLYTQQTRGWPTASATPITASGLFGEFPTPELTGTHGPVDNTQMLFSLRGQKPMTIIDGVQRDFSSIDPDNIESITVLKDALSTIMLGQRSSNGVLLVTTKRAEAGAPRISFTAQTGVQTPLKLPAPLPAYQYAYLYNEALLNEGQPPAYTLADFEAYRNGSDPDGHPDINWFNTILRKYAPLSRYNLNVTGGSHTARYTVSLNYMNQGGIFKTADVNTYNTNAGLNRYTINTNVDVDLNKNFNVALQLFGRIQDGTEPGAGTDTIFSRLYATPNNAYPILNPDGSLGGNQQFRNNLYGMVNHSGYKVHYARDVMANLDLTYRFDNWIKGLWIKSKANLSVQTANTTDRSKLTPVYDKTVSSSGAVTYTRYGDIRDQGNNFYLTSSAQYWYAQAVIGYDKQAGEHDIAAKIFADQQQSTFNYDLPIKNTNIVGNVSYSFGNRYFAEAAVNYSGNDRYRPGARFGWFYAGTLGWDIAQERFIRDNLPWVNLLKLRTTYGRTGNANNVEYFSWRKAYETPPLGGYSFGESRVPFAYRGLDELPLANLNATWEKADKLNIGVDMGLFRDHLQVTGEFYRDKYYDLLQTRGRNTALIGNTYSLENIGVKRYTGAELTLTYQHRINDLNYFITGNASIMQSKVLFMDEERKAFEWNRVTGQPVGALFGYISEGLFQTQKEVEAAAVPAGYVAKPGDIRYKDLNGDKMIDQLDMGPISNTKPLIWYGLTLGLHFKGLELSVLLQGVQNRSILLPVTQFEFSGGFPGQLYERHLGRWIPENAATATYPRLTPGGNVNNQYPSTYWMRSGNYFRIRNIDVGYTLPYRWTSRFRISGVRIFANALNLFTQAAYDEIDPEVYGSTYPIQQVFNTGINVKL